MYIRSRECYKKDLEREEENDDDDDDDNTAASTSQTLFVLWLVERTAHMLNNPAWLCHGKQ